MAAFTLLFALVLASPASALEQKLTASDGAAYDNFGYSVAVDGDTLVIGAPTKNSSAGAVYVYQRVGDRWTQTAKLTASDGAAGDYLGLSVAIDGDTIVAGAHGDDFGSNAIQGSVYTFARTGAAARTETAKLTASDGAAGDYLGYSVAIDGDTIVAGVQGDQVGSNAIQGSVYTFARTGAAARTETAKLTASDGAASDGLGYSVAIDADTIVAGAIRDDIGANADQGSIHTFARTGAATWTETAKLTALDGAAEDYLGDSVAIDGDTIVAGVAYDDIGANEGQGSVYTFARTGAAARTETAKLTASDGATSDGLGWSVSIDADTIVAGAIFGDISADAGQGAVYTFAQTGPAVWTETAKLTASDGAPADTLGYSVSIDADTIVAGAAWDEIGGSTRQGSVSVFFSPADADADGVADTSDSCPTGAAAGPDSDGDGCKNEGEDTDDDNDGVTDASDNCPTGAGSGPDTDGDGCKNAGEDTDDDNDGVTDVSDKCPTTAGDTSSGGCQAQFDTDPPETSITRDPKDKGTKNKVTYKFVADENGSSFECKLDNKPWQPCTSPRKYKVKDGKHKFTVRATDAAGNTDTTADKDKFKVVE